jgi:hypothetical protein
MNTELFLAYLKKRGKKPHVIENLIKAVEIYDKFLRKKYKKTIEETSAVETQNVASLLKGYIATLQADSEKTARKHCRAISLYYKSTGNLKLAKLASSFREKAIAKSKRRFPLKEFRGIATEHLSGLAALNIKYAEQMLEAGGTSELRRQLSKQTGVPLKTITEIVKLSDLARMDGLKGVRARLYYDAGVDTLDKIAGWKPEKLKTMLDDFVIRSNFDGIAPLPREIENTIKTAQKLQRVVEY